MPLVVAGERNVTMAHKYRQNSELSKLKTYVWLKTYKYRQSPVLAMVVIPRIHNSNKEVNLWNPIDI